MLMFSGLTGLSKVKDTGSNAAVLGLSQAKVVSMLKLCQLALNAVLVFETIV